MQVLDIRYPANLVIETTAHCQLRCSMCGRTRTARPFGRMDEALVYSLLDQVADWNKEAIRLWYCFLGEPLLLREKLVDYISYGHSLGLRRNTINTNGNLLDPTYAEALIQAGLNEIYIGIDAVTPETYGKIRVGGDYETLVENVKHLLKIKPDHLQVTVQLIEMDENRHEVDAFRELWEPLGAKVFIKKLVNWISTVDVAKLSKDEARYCCPVMIDTLGIYWNGDVPFCVDDWDGDTVIGSVKEMSLKEIWDLKINQYARHHLLENWDKIPEICKHCSDWQAKARRGVSHLEEILKADG